MAEDLFRKLARRHQNERSRALFSRITIEGRILPYSIQKESISKDTGGRGWWTVPPTPTERTYSFGVEELLYEGYAVCGGLAAPCGGARKDVAVLEGEGDGLLLDPGRTRKAEVCEGTEDKRGEKICKGCECL
jgi:hypothetical protein